MLFSYTTIFLSIRVFFHEYSRFTRQQRSVEGYFLNFSLQLLPASQSLGYKPSDYCRELTSAHSYQPNSNREFSVSKRKSLTTRLSFPMSYIFKIVTNNLTKKWNLLISSFLGYTEKQLSEMFYKKGVLKKFAKFSKKYLWKHPQVQTLLKKDPNTGVFLWILVNS